MADKKTKLPRHLKAATRRWWQEIVETYELESHQVRILTLAAEHGTPLVVEAAGPDADLAVATLSGLLESDSMDDGQPDDTG